MSVRDFHCKGISCNNFFVCFTICEIFFCNQAELIFNLDLTYFCQCFSFINRSRAFNSYY